MPAGKSPPTIVVCGTMSGSGLARSARRGAGGPRVDGAVPVTWLVAESDLAAAADMLTGLSGRHEIALQLPATAFDSRQRLRSLLARGRELLPDLMAVMVRQAEAVAHRELLVEEGIRAVLVDSLPAAGRGSRRPAPTGWRCRNTTWGLWEIELAAARRQGPLSRLGLGALPRVPRGGLGVLATDGWSATGSVHHRLERLVSWAGRQAARGRARLLPLSGLVGRLGGEEEPAVTGSVLRAA
jgi:hypothetical protein